ncbi:LysE family translocator [Nonomuraea sp. NN258]|uniref:LysE family translocator n=1 Tax=Nonomuraea antri TaxID=2730852 RepID=UPI0015684A0F|nr:LysE family translocator [Nonomuraea antri]NRQ38021.1 LysE family translocator [Nonomuraea antri]
MISVSTLVLFASASLALVIIPGPNHLYIAARGLAQGRAAGLASALGVEAGTLVHIAAAAAGLSYLISESATLFAIVKWAGVAYLVYLGVRAFTGKEQSAADAPRPQPLGRVFLEGVLVNVLNPKVALFFLAFLPQFVDTGAGSPALQIVVFGGTLLLLGLLSDVVYALTAGTLGARVNGSRAARKGLRYVSGAVYLGLGVATAFAGRK